MSRFNFTENTDRVSPRLSDAPRSWLSSNSVCASCRAAAMEKRNVASFAAGSLTAMSSKPAAGASPRSTFRSVESCEPPSLSEPGSTNFSNCRCRFSNTSTTLGSNDLPDSAARRCKTSCIGSARRYWRSEAIASRKSTAERIRAPMGMSVPFRPKG